MWNWYESKAKKAKRLKATYHTKTQSKANKFPKPKPSQYHVLSNTETEELKYYGWDEVESPKNTFKWCAVIVLVCMLLTLWMFKVNT